MGRKVEIELEFQNYIDHAPYSPQELYSQACANDGVTMDSWRKIWIDNMKANHAKYGPFKDHSIGAFHGKCKNQPAIIVGSGPSLKHNAPLLKDKSGMTIISCLHNFHYMEDLGVDVDYYVTLDAGDVTAEEVSEGGAKTADEYWAASKGKKLIAFVSASPLLLSKWQGEIYFYNCPIPDKEVQDAMKELEPFNCFISNGGNVLGACLYFAKAFLGANPICFLGADFSFSYGNKFHAWDSKYDKDVGGVMKATDVYGNRVPTWRSYANFKSWFEFVAGRVPGIYINATEGGTFGSYPEGNIRAVTQMTLEGFFEMYRMHEQIGDQARKPETAERRILF